MAERTTIRMNASLKRELVDLARAEGTTFTAVVEEAVRGLIASKRQASSPQKVEVPPLIPKGKGPHLSTEEVIELIDRSEQEYLERKVGNRP